jgi:NTE family protein
MSDPLETGLALSGGGYRAMLFNLGSVWRLNDMGWLRRLDIVTSVSGGSILNGVLATRWAKLDWNAAGVATNFSEIVAQPVRAIAGTTLDVVAGLKGVFSVFSTIADKVTDAYDRHLFGGARLQRDIAPFEKGRTPRFLFYATSLQTGSNVRIERKRLADYRIGEIPNPDLPVARVVTASSAFPPLLSPVALDLDPEAWQPLQGASLFDRQEFKRRLLLTDGGVYDNMGLEAIWDRCKTVLVSDAGAPFEAQTDPPAHWTRQAIRVLDIVTEQTRALRRRMLMQTFQQNHEEGRTDERPAARRGTYWGIKTQIGAYGVDHPLTDDNANTTALQQIRTRLNKFTPIEQGQLINWGYALTDAAMRKYVDAANTAPSQWPIPEFPLK